VGRSRLTTTLALPPVRGTLKADAPLAPLVWFKAGGAAHGLQQVYAQQQEER